MAAFWPRCAAIAAGRLWCWPIWRQDAGVVACAPLVLLMVVLGALAQPVFRQEDREPLSDIVFVVVDKTESQIGGCAPRPRLKPACAEALRAEIGDLGEFRDAGD